MDLIKDIRIKLLLVAVFSFGVAVLAHFYLGVVSGIQLLAIPFDLFGKGLRGLSLSSALGNVVAYIIYVGFALIPSLYWLRRIKKGQKKLSGVLLPVITIYSLFLMYFFINPGVMIGKWFPQFGYDTMVIEMKVIIAALYWGLWFSYFLLTISDSVLAPDSYHKSAPMIRHLQYLLRFGAFFYTVCYCGVLIFPLLTRLSNVSAIEGTVVVLSTAKIFFLILDYVIDGIPVVITVCILVKGESLLEAMDKSHLKEEERIAAIALGKVSKLGLNAIIICGLASNLLKLIMSGYLLDININIYLPLFPLIIALGTMILSGYFKEAGELKENDDLFI